MDVEALTPASQSAAAQSVANFLQALHGLQPSSEVATLLPRDDDRLVAEECLARAERAKGQRAEQPPLQIVTPVRKPAA